MTPLVSPAERRVYGFFSPFPTPFPPLSAPSGARGVMINWPNELYHHLEARPFALSAS